MPFTLVKGTFMPRAGIPDGDSIRFRPHDPYPLFALPRQGRSPRLNPNNGTVQLRYEGIDAMEKGAKEPWVSDATDKNIEFCGLEGLDDEAEGHILSNQIGPNGRPICFVFFGNTEEKDGSSVFLDVERMMSSINYRLMGLGLVYPLYYDTLYGDLREALTQAVIQARDSDPGVWPYDRTQTGVSWRGAASLSDLSPIMPKLWRRLEKYTQNRDFRDESDTLDAFIAYLEAKKDRLFIISESRFTDLDDIVEVQQSTIRLPYLPEDLIFMS